ncbi:MAG: ABC transporter permease [Arthrobacter sp.]|nr:ABC transporter permease [Arthrobacter sp.]
MNTLVKANVVAYRRRYAAVIAAVTIGVAFLAATLFVGSSVRATLSASVGQAYQHADIVVDPKFYRADESIKLTPQQAADHVKATDGVKSALAYANTMVEAQLGSTLESVYVTITQGDTSLLGTSLVEGSEPGAGQATLNAAAAKKAGLTVGSTLNLTVGENATKQVTLSGLRQDPQDPSAAGYANLQLSDAGAKALGLGFDPQFVIATLQPQAQAEQVTDSIATWMHERGLPSAEATTSTQKVTDQIKSLSGGVDALTWVLGAFAGIALVVTVLVVANTFSVILAQRTRELALLRTLGAKRAQIRRMVLSEAVVVGLVGGLLGVLIGTGVVAGGAAIVRSAFDLPYVTFGFSWTPIVAGLIVGLLVTVLASLRPALAATRVSPLAALRPSETVTVHSKAGTTRVVIGSLLVLLGAAALIYGVLPTEAVSSSFETSFGMAFLGGLVSFIGVLVLGTLLIPWAVRQLARPFGAKIAGRLAGLNALRHPQRTSAIGTALLLGVTLVSLMLVGATSARTTINAELAKQYPVDLVISSSTDAPLTGEVQAPVRDVKGVASTAFLTPVAMTKGCLSQGNAAETTEYEPCAFVLSGDAAELAATSTNGAKIPALGSVAVGEYALAGSAGESKPTEVTLSDGAGRTVTVPVDAEAAAPMSSIVMTDETRKQVGLPTQLPASKETSDAGAPGPQVWVKADDSVSAGPLISDVASAAKVQQTQLDGALPIRQMASQIIDTLLMVVSALLAVAVIIALIGVSNTLSLSVIERTRENSLLRALGLTKKQLRGMLALEAALIAGAAAVLGIVLGAVYGLAGARAATSSMGGFAPSIPWLWLAVVLVVSVGAAILASVWPARRAARLSPVEGLAVE